MSHLPWKDPFVFTWTTLLLESYHFWMGKPLLPLSDDSPENLAKRVYEAPFVIVSHNNLPDPLLNYGNELALQLWEMAWDEFIGTPSRLTAEPMNQEERSRMLQRATKDGYICDYRGIRIAKSGRRFLVENAIVWNIFDKHQCYQGQTSTFSQWTFL